MPSRSGKETEDLSQTQCLGGGVQKTCLTISQTVSRAEGSLGRGMKWAAFENRSTTTIMTVNPVDEGTPCEPQKVLNLFDRVRLWSLEGERVAVFNGDAIWGVVPGRRLMEQS